MLHPVPRVLALIVGLIVFVLVMVVGVAGVALRTTAAIRAYVGGEGLWSKGEKDAAYALASYAVTGSPSDYEQFLESLSVPLGDRIARLELEKRDMRREVVVQGLRLGHNHPDDFGDLIWMFRTFRHISYMERAIAIWEEGDVWIDRLRAAGAELDAEVRAGPLADTRRRLYLGRITEINRHVTKLEDEFSSTLGEAARWIRSTSIFAVLALSAGLLAVAVWAAFGISGLVERSDASVRDALEREEAASRTKSTFLGLVSHEFRTPLTALQLQIERLRLEPSGRLGPRGAEILGRMVDASHRLAEMIDSLLQYVRIESGGLQLSLEPVDAAAVVAETLEEIRLLAQRKGLTLALHAPPELPCLVTDHRLFRFLVTNLVGNAIKFTQEGSIDVTLAHDGAEHRVVVKDTGPGIAPQDHERVFRAFEQLEPVHGRHAQGIGLGLALVKQIADALHGRVELASTPGKGSAFAVMLPPLVP
jgi:signal transduction histidine kinase